MGNKQPIIKPINNICPISLCPIKNGIVLECRHNYSIFNIQRYCLDFIIKDKQIFCPICKKNINKKQIKLIFKNWILFKQIYDNWNQSNIIKLKDAKRLFIKNTNIETNNNNKIIIPLFKKKKLIKTCLLRTPLMNGIKIINNNNLFKSKLNKNYTTKYGEEVNNISLCLVSKFKYSSDIGMYISLIAKILKKKYFDSNINIDNIINEISKFKIYFFIDNQLNVTTYDRELGIMEKNFFFKTNSCKILFSPYIITNNNKSFLINKIYSIIY